MTERHIPIEISVATEPNERPSVDSGTRIDVSVNGQLYPTSRLVDGRYVAWWFDTEAPDPDDPATTEWVAAPTRFLAAGTLHELWEDPAAFDDLVETETETETEAEAEADAEAEAEAEAKRETDAATDTDSGTGTKNEPIEGPAPPKPFR